MRPIWAPWRMAYVESGAKEPGCIFCDRLRESDARAGLLLARTSHSLVMLNKYPYNAGHLLLAPQRHTNDMTALARPEYEDLCETLRCSVAIVQRVLKPGGINLGMNLGRCAGAGVEDHLHWHVVPRWEGDTNFMPVVGEVKVISQHLLESYDRLSPHFKELSVSEHA